MIKNSTRTLAPAAVLVHLLALWLCGPARAEIDFTKQVLPILESRCFDCHRATYVDTSGRKRRPKGGLRLDGKHWIRAGGSNGAVVVAGAPAQSSLFLLTTLPADDADIMPAKGDPLTKRQTDILRRWIEEGASFGDWVGAPGPMSAPKGSGTAGTAGTAGAADDVPAALRHLLALGKGVAAASPASIETIRRTGAAVRPVLPGSPLLRVDFISRESSTDDAAVKALKPIAGNIAQLDLARTQISDEALATIASMTRLARLDLRRTDITDAGIARLRDLEDLRYLNLYGTGVTDSVVVTLGRLSRLDAVYLWQTKVTPAGVEALRRILPDARIVAAPDLPEAPSPDDPGPRRR